MALPINGDRLHPENQILSINDVDQCSHLEEEAFSPEERASREKVKKSLACLTVDLFCLRESVIYVIFVLVVDTDSASL